MEPTFVTDAMCAQGEGSIEPCAQSALDALERRRNRTAAKLADIDAAISALKANPEILRVLDLMAKANR